MSSIGMNFFTYCTDNLEYFKLNHMELLGYCTLYFMPLGKSTIHIDCL